MGDIERTTLGARLVESIAAIDAADWDACAGPGNPFVSHAFLSALEESRSVGGRSGWTPRHLVVSDGAGHVVATAPLYLKTHSQGEYVFDHGWAEAFERAGGRYYPKLQLAVPFTPVPGPRLLLRPGGDAARVRPAVAEALIEVAKASGVSSLHVTFAGEADMAALGDAGFLPRLGHQYHWHNRGYGSFDDFLGDLRSAKRKAIRRERRDVVASGVVIRVLTGDAILPEHWDAFFRFYMDTGSRKWGRPYLTRAFFDLLGAAMADRLALVLCFRDEVPVAGALNLIGDDALYGRYWGCLEDHRFLHFEACYYQAIELAIARRLPRVEAGAQGEHKLQRGYVPVATASAHWIAHGGFRDAVADFLVRERRAMEREIAVLAEHHTPFHRAGEP